MSRIHLVVVAFSLWLSACTAPAASPVAPSAAPALLPPRPEIADAMSLLAGIGRPVTVHVSVDTLPQGVHAMATSEIVVSEQWLDSHLVSTVVLAGILSHEQWHLDRGPHTCADGRRDRRGWPGAWQYQSETLRMLGAVDASETVASARANYCD